jgi:endoglycosylceramidase
MLVLLALLFPLHGKAAIKEKDPTTVQSGHACWLPDGQGRFFLPRGFVTVTEDQIGPVNYTADDYQRMLRYGANCQVIRLTLGKLGGWPGTTLQKNYLQQVDEMVLRARKAGLKTFFKMTVYGIEGFERPDGWDKLLNSEEHQQHLIKAWQTIWTLYQDDLSVIGYDLLNEPFRGSPDADYQKVSNEQLIPLYRKIIDELHLISPDKWALYQPLLLDHEDRKPRPILIFVTMNIPLDRERIIFAPHGYFPEFETHVKAVKHHLRQANISGAKLMMGEWGKSTQKETDASFDEQLKLQLHYTKVANLYDRNQMGTIKAWFTGTTQLHNKHTWSIFSDPVQVGSVERKYIVDVIARPCPLTVAGRVSSYGYDFKTRTFTLQLEPDTQTGPSEIYIGENRHYPDGFTVLYNEDLVFVYKPQTDNAIKNASGVFRFNQTSQRLIIERWPGKSDRGILKIKPGGMN